MARTGRVTRNEFAARLRTSTAEDYERLQRQPFVQTLLAGELEADAYATLLAQHYFVYEALEAAADFMRPDLVAGPFVSDRLRRLPALQQDMQYYFGPDWRDVIRPSSATEQYRARIDELCFDWPGGFVAHHYSRYLDDLSGGPAVRAAVSRGLGQQDGFASLVFEEIPNPGTFKQAYRTLLDTAGWSPAEQKRIIAEVHYAYWLYGELLADLGARIPPRVPAQRRR